MNGTKFKEKMDWFLEGCDEGPYHDQAREVLMDFGKQVFPSIAKMCEREAALAKLTRGEIMMLGLENLPPIEVEESDNVEMLRRWIATYRRTQTTKSNCADAALEGLLGCVINMENDI